MRVVAGKSGGIPLKVPKTELRPTMDMVKSAIFSSLGDQVVGALQPDVEAKAGARCGPGGCAALRPEGDREAFEATPGEAQGEEFEPVHHGSDGRGGTLLEDHPEQTARACEVAFPKRMARIAIQRRVEHARDLGPRLQPARDGKRILLMACEAHAKGAQAACCQKYVVRRDGVAEATSGFLNAGDRFLGSADGADERIGVPHDVLGAGLDGQIGAER